MVAAWPRCVASYGVMPQTYMLAAPAGSLGWTPCRAESYNASGSPLPGSRGTSCPAQDSMGQPSQPGDDAGAPHG